MTETVYTLTLDSIAKLNRDHERLAHEVRGMRAMLRAYMSEIGDAEGLIGKTDGSGITASTASQLGSGTVTLWSVSASGAIAATSVTMTVYNVSGTAVAATTMIKFSRVGAIFSVDVEDCS